MSDIKSLISTLLHLCVDKIGLSSATRAILLPHMPTLVNFMTNISSFDDIKKNMKDVVLNIDIFNYFVYLLFVVIIISSITYGIKYLRTKKSKSNTKENNEENNKDEEKDKVSYNYVIDNIIDVMGIIYYLKNNAENPTIIHSLLVSDIHIIYNSTSSKKFDINFNTHDMNTYFNKTSIVIPKTMKFNLVLNKMEHGVDECSIKISASEKTVQVKEKNENVITMITKTIPNDYVLSIDVYSMEKSKFNALSFYNYFTNKIQNYYFRTGNNKTILYKKIINNNNRYENEKVLFTHRDNISYNEMFERTMIKFIHPQKYKLIKIIEKFMNPDSYPFNSLINHISLLLHGPPGSGKSSLAFLLAMIFNRHVVLVDLKMYKKLSDLKKFILFYRNEENILLIDEFDSFIRLLQNNDEHKNKENEYDYNETELLSIFDETMMASNSITIVTTNNPNVINEIGRDNAKGAMVRAGRLRQIYYGYFNKKCVEEIFEINYPGEKILVEDDWFDDNHEMKIPNSNLMELVSTMDSDNISMEIYKEIENYGKLLAKV